MHVHVRLFLLFALLSSAFATRLTGFLFDAMCTQLEMLKEKIVRLVASIKNYSCSPPSFSFSFCLILIEFTICFSNTQKLQTIKVASMRHRSIIRGRERNVGQIMALRLFQL